MSNEDRLAVVYQPTFLKVKLKSLAAESKIIKKQVHHGTPGTRNALHWHRIFVVRPEARATHIAYGLIRGRTYESMEGKAKTKPDWSKVKAMLKKYGPQDWERLMPTTSMAKAA